MKPCSIIIRKNINFEDKANYDPLCLISNLRIKRTHKFPESW